MKLVTVALSLLLCVSLNAQSPFCNWAFNSQLSTGTDYGTCIVADAAGNVFVAGKFFGTIDLDPGIGVQSYTAVNTGDLFIAKYDAVGNYVWSGVLDGNNQQEVNDICLDPSGNVVIAGNYSGTTDFDMGAGVQSGTAFGIPDGFVAMYDPSGAYIHFFTFSTSANSCEAITCDNAGNLYVTGWFRGSGDFDPGVGVLTLTNAGGGENAFIAKYTNAGAYVFAFSLGTSTAEANGNEIHINAAGSVLVGGTFKTTVDFDPSAVVQNQTATAVMDIFFAQYDATGNYQQSFHLGGGNFYPSCASVNTDQSGNILLTGNFSGTVDFDPGINTNTLTSNGQSDIFCAKYSPAGAYQWAIGVGGGMHDYALDGTIDAQGNVYVTGRFPNTVDFDPGVPVKNVIAAGANLYDIYAASYSPNGIYRWAFGIGDTLDADYGYGITTSGTAVYLTGGFAGTADFDPGSGVRNLSYNGGKYDLYVAKYDADPDGIVGTSMQTSFNVYPVPASDLIAVHIDPISNHTFLEIINSLGQVVVRREADQTELTIDISGLAGGLYYCNLVGDTGILANRKLIITRN